jgi:hypothetical protein
MRSAVCTLHTHSGVEPGCLLKGSLSDLVFARAQEAHGLWVRAMSSAWRRGGMGRTGRPHGGPRECQRETRRWTRRGRPPGSRVCCAACIGPADTSIRSATAPAQPNAAPLCVSAPPANLALSPCLLSTSLHPAAQSRPASSSHPGPSPFTRTPLPCPHRLRRCLTTTTTLTISWTRRRRWVAGGLGLTASVPQLIQRGCVMRTTVSAMPPLAITCNLVGSSWRALRGRARGSGRQ